MIYSFSLTAVERAAQVRLVTAAVQVAQEQPGMVTVAMQEAPGQLTVMNRLNRSQTHGQTGQQRRRWLTTSSVRE